LDGQRRRAGGGAAGGGRRPRLRLDRPRQPLLPGDGRPARRRLAHVGRRRRPQRPRALTPAGFDRNAEPRFPSGNGVLSGGREGRMKVHPLHPWDLTQEEAVALQKELAGRVDTRTPLTRCELVAGADVSYNRFSPIFYAAVVVLRTSDWTVV